MNKRQSLETIKHLHCNECKAETSEGLIEAPANSETPPTTTMNATTAKTPATRKTKPRKATQRASNRRRVDKKSARLNMLSKMLDEIFNAYIETDDGSILPIRLPEEYFIMERQKERLHDYLRKAIKIIRKSPSKFYEHPDFLSLIEMAANTHGAFRLPVSIPASVMKNKEALKLLPLPVKIGQVTSIAEATGNDEDMVTFDWFSTDDPRPYEKTMMLISNFFGELLTAMNIL